MLKNKKIFALLLSFIVMLSVLNGGMIAYADNGSEDDIIDSRYTYIASYHSTFVISGVTATCTARLTASSSTTISIKMELQKKKSGTYETIKTWSDSKTGTSISLSKTKTINALSTYRLKTTFKAGNETAITYKAP